MNHYSRIGLSEQQLHTCGIVLRYDLRLQFSRGETTEPPLREAALEEYPEALASALAEAFCRIILLAFSLRTRVRKTRVFQVT